MRIWLAIAVALGACLGACLGGCLGGCKDHDVERLTEIKRDVCACKDARCADQAMSEVPKTSIRATPRTQAIARDILECRARLEAADQPNTDPDAEGGSDSSGEPSPAAGSAGSAPAPAPPQTAPAAPPAPAKAAR